MSLSSLPSPESKGGAFALLTCLSRTQLREADEQRARQILSGTMDWGVFLRAAQFHGMLPLVYHHMVHCDWINAPESEREFARERAKAHSFKSLFLVNELCRVTGHLQSRGIPVMSIKGPTLARLAYGDVRLRWFGDLDLVIDRKSTTELDRALTEIGYELRPVRVQRSRWVRNWKLLIGAQCSYVRGASFYHLDVHTNVLPLHFRHRVPLSRLRARSLPVDMGSCVLSSPEPEILLQVLCLHGQKNRWETLKYVCDVNELIRAFPELRWEDVLEEAEAHGGLSALLLGLLLAEQLLSTPLPSSVRNRINRRKTLGVIAGEVLERYPSVHETWPLGLRDRTKLHYLLQDSIVGKARYIGTAMLQRLVLRRKPPESEPDAG